MKGLEDILNKVHQRAGLLAVITGVLQTSNCESTKKSIASILKHIFDEYSVNDDIERMTKRVMNEVLEQKDEQKDQMQEMLERLKEILKD